MASVVAYEGEDGESGEGENISDIHRKKPNVHHRKRKKSIRESDETYLPPYKKNNNRFRRQVSVLPSKFLLGGNIRDPLNLASLADAKVNAELNKATPTSSPLGVPSNSNNQQPHGQIIPVFIPKNPVDPLGLSLPTDNPDDIIAGVRKHKKRNRRRHGRKRTDSECSVGTDTVGDDEEEEEAELKERKKENEPKKEPARESKAVGGNVVPEAKSGSNKKGEGSGEAQMVRTRSQSLAKSTKDSVVLAEPKRSPIPDPKPKPSPAVESRKKEKDSVDEASQTTKVDSTPKKEEKPVIIVTKDTPKEETVREGDVEAASSTRSVASDSKTTPKTNGDEAVQQSGVYPCKSSEYVPLSSSYAPSPYIFDTMNPEDGGFEVKPFESPSLTNYYCNAVTPSHLMEPFSPPPRPEVPDFQRRMQMMSSHPHRPHQLSLQRAVFQKPFYRRRFRHKSDPIVSPVIPQPGCGRRNHHHHHNHNHNHRHNKKNDKQGNSLNTSNTSANSTHSSASKKGTTGKAKQANVHCKDEITNFRSKDEIYQFGNYKQYYGYRTSDGEDSRLWVLKKEWFRGKDVLDIGCNIGHVTLSIARDFEAQRVHGIDIDNNLITTARKNIKHYMIHDPSDKTIVFPHSLPMIYGAMQPSSGVGMMTPQQFPFNVMISQENYVLSNDAQLESVKPEYDVILCLSVTKWIHLNFGDEGLKRFFRRIHRHLRKDGKLILEPQEWSSYHRKRKLTAKISENFKNITLKPDHFQNFLVRDVGFTFVQKLGTPHHSKGFQRPMLIFCKESKGSSPVTEQNAAASDSTAIE